MKVYVAVASKIYVASDINYKSQFQATHLIKLVD